MNCIAKLRTTLICLFVCTFIYPVSSASETSENIKETTTPAIEVIQPSNGIFDCNRMCGCDKAYIYNETTNECNLDLDYIIQMVMRQRTKDRSIPNDNEDHDMANDKGMAKSLRIEADQVFQSIIISALLFIGCATLCVFSASIYCCHIKYSDKKMDKNIKALAQKLNTTYKSRKSVRKQPLEPIEESCNVVVEEAGLFVV